MKKRAQAWGFDLMIGLTIFVIGLLAFYLFIINIEPEKNTFKDLKNDGEKISNDLLSEGYPTQWSQDNVRTIGLISKERINETKLEYFYNLSLNDYQKAKSILGTNFNFYVHFQENMTLFEKSIEGIGEKPINQKDSIKITRLTIYQDKPNNLYIQLWQ
jgi:hypothetical protein